MYAVIRSGESKSACRGPAPARRIVGEAVGTEVSSRPSAGGRRHVLATPTSSPRPRSPARSWARSRAEDPCHDLQGEEQPAATLGPPPALRDGGDHLHRCGLRKGTPCRRPRWRFTRNGRDSNANGSGQDLQRHRRARRVDPGTPARHALSPRHQRRPWQRRHALRPHDGVVKFGPARAASWSTSSRLIERRYRGIDATSR